MKDFDKKQGVRTVGVGDSAYISKWTLLILAGVLLEFIGRFIGYAKNPLGFYFPIIAAITVIIAALVVLYGFFKVWRGFNGTITMATRTGFMFIVMGAIMIVSFMLFKQIMPLIFGFGSDPAPVEFLSGTPGF